MPAPGEGMNGRGARPQCQTGGIRQLGVHRQVRSPERLCHRGAVLFCAGSGGCVSADDIAGMLHVGLQQGLLALPSPGLEAVPLRCGVLCVGLLGAAFGLEPAVQQPGSSSLRQSRWRKLPCSFNHLAVS